MPRVPTKASAQNGVGLSNNTFTVTTLDGSDAVSVIDGFGHDTYTIDTRGSVPPPVPFILDEDTVRVKDGQGRDQYKIVTGRDRDKVLVLDGPNPDPADPAALPLQTYGIDTGERNDLLHLGDASTTEDNNRFYVLEEVDLWEEAGTPQSQLGESDLAAAARYLEDASAIDPSNGRVLGNSATLLNLLGRGDEALTLWKAIAVRDPVNVNALFNLGTSQINAVATSCFDSGSAPRRQLSLTFPLGSGW